MSLHPGRQDPSACIGILAAHPLRSIGLQSILEDGLKLRVVILSDETRPRGCKLNLLIVDENFDSQPRPGAPLSRVLLSMPGVAVIVLSRGNGTEMSQNALAAGARAVLPETADPSEIRACIRAVLKGKTWSSRESGSEDEQAKGPLDRPQASLAHRFTPKEREVMHWLTHGRSNREIAGTMRIDEATVKAHLGRMLRKAKATNRVELTLRALSEVKPTRMMALQSTRVPPK